VNPRIAKILSVGGAFLACYFAAYFGSVRTDRFAHKDTVVPLAYYRPVDGLLVRGVFWFAHLVDAAYLRPRHWEPSSAPHPGESNHVPESMAE
jgi:hypothetical protein